MPDVADLDAAIRQRLAKWSDEPCGYATCTVMGWAEMKSTILAVLDYHSAREEDGCCLSCLDWTEYDDGRLDTWWAPFPCDTVRKIAKGLGIEVPDV